MKAKTKTVFVVRYTYDGENSLEAVLNKREDFDKWLRMYNFERYEKGEMIEGADNFTVDSMELYLTIEDFPEISDYDDENED